MTDATESRHAIDMAATMARYTAWEAAAAKLVPDNKQRLFAHLALANITRVVVIFDGEGDSGQIEDIQAYVGDEQASLPEGKVDSLDLPYGETQPVLRRHRTAPHWHWKRSPTTFYARSTQAGRIRTALMANSPSM